MRGIGNELRILPTPKRPLRMRHLDAIRTAMRSYRERGVRVVETHRWKRRADAPRAPREGTAEDFLRARDLQMRLAGDRLAVLRRDGQTAQQPLRVIRLHLPIPTAPKHGEAMLHEKAMPGMRLRLRIIRALAIIEGPQREHIAAVVHVVEQHPVALGHIDRLQQKKVRPALHLAASIARCPL